MLEWLDTSFFVFHTALILFILVGWIWKRTLKLHLAAVLLTAFSWFVLGLRYGIGFCPCTEWHWRVKMLLEEPELPHSYLKYLADTWTGKDFDPFLVDVLTFLGFFLAAALSIARNWWRRTPAHQG